MPNAKLKDRLTIDVNTGENLELTNYTQIVCDSATCNEIISTTLQTVASAITLPNKPISMSIYLVEAEEGHQLNFDYRGKDYATNVLSFEIDIPPMIVAELEEFELGELIVCLPVVIREAAEQQKTVQNHLTHLLIHGCLHLLGYDHELSETFTEEDADKMEQVEIAVLHMLGITNPYND